MSLNDVFEFIGLFLLHVRHNVHNWSGQRVVLQARMRYALLHLENHDCNHIFRTGKTKCNKIIKVHFHWVQLDDTFRNIDISKRISTWTRVFSIVMNISTFLSILDGFCRSNLLLKKYRHIKIKYISITALRTTECNSLSQNSSSPFLRFYSPALLTFELVCRTQNVAKGSSRFEVQKDLCLEWQKKKGENINYKIGEQLQTYISAELHHINVALHFNCLTVKNK